MGERGRRKQTSLVMDALLLRSLLFFPGIRPALYPKALGTGADAVCIDLEDSVGPDQKEEARQAAIELLVGADDEGLGRTFLRINGPRTGPGLQDMTALADSGARLSGVVIPKVDGAEDVLRVVDILQDAVPSVGFVPIVETARGLAAAEDVALASTRTVALLFGGFDLSAELGTDGGWESLLYARSRVVHAAALARVPSLDAPHLDLTDEDGLRGAARAARGLGFTGMLAIHPGQVGAIQEAFSPTPDEIAWARKISDAYDQGGEGVLVVEGRVVERPVIASARRIIALAKQMG